MFIDLSGKKILMLSGMRTMCDYVERAQKLGAYVYVADIDYDSPAKKIADEAIFMDVTDEKQIVDFCKKNCIDGITTGFADILLEPYYLACNQLNLPCYLTPQIIDASTNKQFFKKKCREYSVPVADDYNISNDNINKKMYELEFPVFVKPLDASGSRGAGVCNNIEDFLKQYECAVSFSKQKKVIVEEYLTGVEFLMDYFVIDGQPILWSMFDRYMSVDRGSAINHSDICVAPSAFLSKFKEEVHPNIVKMLKGMGIKNGVVFFQGFSNEKEIKLYEMGCRLGGTFQAVDEVCMGINPMDMLAHYCVTGKMINSSFVSKIDTRYQKIGGVINIMAAASNKQISKIKGVEEVLSMKNVVHHIPRMKVGDYINGSKFTDCPVISFYFWAHDIEEYKNIIDEIYSKVEVEDKDGNTLLMTAYDTNQISNWSYDGI